MNIEPADNDHITTIIPESTEVQPDLELNKFFEAKNKIEELNNSMRIKGSRPFEIICRVLTKEELAEVETNLNDLMIGLDYDGLENDVFGLIDKMLYFQSMNGDTSENQAVEQLTKNALGANVKKLDRYITENNLKTTAKAFQLATFALESQKPVHIHEAKELIIAKANHIPFIIDNINVPFIDNLANLVKSDLVFENKEVYEQMIHALTESTSFSMGSFLTDAILFEDLQVQSFGQQLFHEILRRKHKMDVGNIIEIWLENAGGSAVRERNIRSNIITLDKLALYNNEAPDILYKEFGILNFGRYPIDLLKHQFNERDNIDKPYEVVVYPGADHNGSFHNDVNILNKIFQATEVDLNYRVIESPNIVSFIRTMNRIAKKYGPASGGILSGHGTEHSLRMGNSQGNRINSLYATHVVAYLNGQFDDKPIELAKRRRDRFFRKNATLVLNSCSTGKGPNPLGKHLSALDLTVVCPTNDTTIGSFRGTVVDGALVPDVVYNGAHTRTFKNGIEI